MGRGRSLTASSRLGKLHSAPLCLASGFQKGAWLLRWGCLSYPFQMKNNRVPSAHSEPMPTVSASPVLFPLPALEKAHTMVNKSLD